MADNSAMGLSNLTRMAESRQHGRSVSYKMEPLIRSIMLCGHLRGDSALAPAIHGVGVLVGFKHGWLTDSGATLPSRSTIQRHRFTLDAALCIAVRNKFQVFV